MRKQRTKGHRHPPLARGEAPDDSGEAKTPETASIKNSPRRPQDGHWGAAVLSNSCKGARANAAGSDLTECKDGDKTRKRAGNQTGQA